MKTTIAQLKQLIREELKLALVEKKTYPSWRQAIKADAGLGSYDDIRSSDRQHSDALERSERDQVAAGADIKHFPHTKRRSYIKAGDRMAKRKEREALRKADAAEAPMTSGDAPISIDRSMLDTPTLQEDGDLMLDPSIHGAIEQRMREVEWEKEQERRARELEAVFGGSSAELSGDDEAAHECPCADDDEGWGWSSLEEGKMKITKSYLKQVIKEELESVLGEYPLFSEEDPGLRLAKAHDTHLNPSIDTERDIIDRERSFGPDNPDLIEIAKELAWRAGKADRVSYDWRKFMPEAEEEYNRRYGDEMLEAT